MMLERIYAALWILFKNVCNLLHDFSKQSVNCPNIVYSGKEKGLRQELTDLKWDNYIMKFSIGGSEFIWFAAFSSNFWAQVTNLQFS